MMHPNSNILPPAAGQPSGANAGFTLIELLVVMAIIATLGGLGLVVIPRLLGSSEEKSVETVIQQISTAIEAYETRPANGDYPPTMLTEDFLPGVGVQRNDDNLGIESVVLCLNRKGKRSSFDIEDVPWPNALTNFDKDVTKRVLTDFGEGIADLYEITDFWGTPFAYFHHRDYSKVETKNLGRIVGAGGQLKCKPWKASDGRWYKRNSFQLISAGPDGEFNTDDDVTNFERN